MNRDWAKFLLTTDNVSGAGFDETAPAVADLVFAGDHQPVASESVCDLSADALLHITGADAESFLQGQFSNDVAKLTVHSSQLNTWSTPKGRVLSLFRLYRLEDGFLLKLPVSQTDAVVKRLRMFVLRAAVQIDIISDQVAIGVSGTGASEKLREFCGELPDTVDACVFKDGLLVARVRSALPSLDIPRYEIAGPVGQLETLWLSLADQCQVCSEARWRLQNIDAGVPAIGESTSEAFVLQMLNLNHIDGVSFKKGCFPGQEVVARMQYLGKLKRRMYRTSVNTSDDAEPPLPGAEIYTEGSNSAVGKIVDAQMDGNGESRMLAVLAIESAAKPLTVGKEQGLPVTILELPYDIPAQAE